MLVVAIVDDWFRFEDNFKMAFLILVGIEVEAYLNILCLLIL